MLIKIHGDAGHALALLPCDFVPQRFRPKSSEIWAMLLGSIAKGRQERHLLERCVESKTGLLKHFKTIF